MKMIRLRKPYVLEWLVYMVVWLIVFLAPVVIAYWPVNPQADSALRWQMVTRVWAQSILPFFLLFCLNNFWLTPYLLLRKRYIRYVVSVFLSVSLFVWVDVTISRKRPVTFFSINADRERLKETRGRWAEIRLPKTQLPDEAEARLPESLNPEFPGESRTFRGGRPERGLQAFPGMMIVPVMSRFLIAVLMISFNIAAKLLLKSLQDEEAMKELERHKLQSELEYLKYQINPHFFMNTLNNIHALVDVNTGQARKAIVELSKMMSYVLYETSNKTILLSREILFLNNYIELMKLRYIDKVNVKTSLPDDVPPIKIPPLLYISFIENAFKHGVSYQSDSLIYVALRVEERDLVFTCSNTNNGRQEEQHKGIGLENIKKRLRLLYGNAYTLSVNESPDRFNVLLIIPFV